MAQYYYPSDANDGVFINADYWNKLYGDTGSLQYLYENYTHLTSGYHLRLQKTNPDSTYTSWIMPNEYSSWYSVLGPPTSHTIVNWNYAAIDDYPSTGMTMWNNINNVPSQVVIQDSGYYFVHVHLNLNNISVANGELYGHIIRKRDINTYETIGTDMIMRTPINNTMGFPTWSNKLTTMAINISSVYFLEKNDILYVVLQSSISTDRTTSFIANNYTFVPTAYVSSFAKGTTSFVNNSIRTSFVSAPYIGLSPSFFEIMSIRMES